MAPAPLTGLVFASCVIAGVALAARRWRLDRPAAFLAGALPLAAAIMAVAMAYAILGALDDPWSALRLAPTIAFTQGHPFYTLPGEGAVLNTIYGPVTYLTFLPAALLSGPTAILLAAAALNALLMFLPVAACCIWMCRRGRMLPAQAFALSLIFAAFALDNPSLAYSTGRVHSDAPAIAYAGLALFAIMLFDPEKTGRRAALPAALCGLFAALAFWTKQTFAPVVAVPILFVGLAWGLRPALRVAAIMALCAAVVTLALTPVVDLPAMRYNAFTVPSAHPWYLGDRSLFNYWAGTAMTAEYLLMILIVGAVVFAAQFIPDGATQSARTLLRERPENVLLLFAAALFPFCALGVIKVGGDVNSYSPVIYFLSLFVLLALPGLSAPPRRDAMLLALLALFFAPHVKLLREDLRLSARVSDNALARQCAYLETHRGRVYFPFNPLAHLLVERTLYNSNFGVRDRMLAGENFSREEFLRHVPPGTEVVVVPAELNWDEVIPAFMPEFTERIRIDGFGDKWLCLAKPGGAPQ